MGEFYFFIRDNVAALIGIITAIPVFWTWYEVIWGRKKRYRKWFAESSQSVSARPSVLLCDFKIDGSIRAQFETTRAIDPLLKEVPSDRILTCEWKKGTPISPSDLPEIVTLLRKKIGELSMTGTDTVYLVYAGPMPLAVIAGAELSNGAKVVLYHYEAGKYVNWGPLTHRPQV